MTINIKHAKTNGLTDWTQVQLDSIIAGNPPPLPPSGTTLSQVVLPSDWNANLNVTGGAVNGIVYSPTSTSLDSTTDLTWDNTAKAFAANGTVTATKTGAGGATRNAFAQAVTAGSTATGDYTIGHTFVPADFITVTELGRYYITGNTQNHQIAIWEKATPTLVTSGTILAASPSDANGFKYVAVTPVVLDPTKEYVIGALETTVDTWKNLWDSTNFFDQFIRRTGWAFVGGTTLAKPITFGGGVNIYNACTFKFTTSSTVQVKAAYDSTNSLGMLSRSDGSSSFIAGGSDKAVGILNPLSLGGGSTPSGYQLGINGGLRIDGSVGAQIVNENGEPMFVGALNNIGRNAVGNQGGYLYLESGAGAGQVLINYSNPARDVSVGQGIGSGKFNIFMDSASKVGHIVRLAASASANAYEAQDSSGVVLASISAAGKQSFDSTITPAGTTGARTINKPSGTVNFAAGATSLVVTNSLVTTSSIVLAVIRTNDATAVIKNVVPASGSFTINLNAAATAETSVGFIVHN